MRNSRIVQLGVLLAAATLAALPPAPAPAATTIYVPPGTRVGLQFVTPVDSSRITPGTRVQFKVIANVVSGRRVIIRSGTPVTGTVTKVTKPGMFGQSSTVVIGFLNATAVDGRPIRLQDVTVSKATVSNSRVGAAGAAAAGAIVLGPVGLLAGALVRGGSVKVPSGTVVTDVTISGANVRAS